MNNQQRLELLTLLLTPVCNRGDYGSECSARSEKNGKSSSVRKLYKGLLGMMLTPLQHGKSNSNCCCQIVNLKKSMHIDGQIGPAIKAPTLEWPMIYHETTTAALQ